MDILISRIIASFILILIFWYVWTKPISFVAWFEQQVKDFSPPGVEKLPQDSNSKGGPGGSATVNGSGIAIGGPGGHAGKNGQGGAGGSAKVNGPGIAAGGAGGSVDSDVLWSPPAQSGYEVAMEALGKPIDPKLRQFGRGGMSAGYAMRYDVVEKIREGYFKAHHKTSESALENVNAVPLEYVNQKLAEMGVNWRARIVRNLDYEFYVPPEA